MSYMGFSRAMPIVPPVTDPGYEILGTAKLASNNRIIEVTGLSAREFLVVHLFLLTIASAEMQLDVLFNGDTGANYGHQVTFLQQGSAPVGYAATSGQNQMRLWRHPSLDQPTGGTLLHGTLWIANRLAQSKMVNSLLGNNANAGPAVGQGFWYNTVAQITAIRLRQAQAADVWDAGSEMIVMGRSA